jgi:hypothetical protein
MPGLSIPGYEASQPVFLITELTETSSILSMGPSFSLNAQGKISLGVIADIEVSSTFDLPQLNLVFPPSQGQSAAQVIPGSTR